MRLAPAILLLILSCCAALAQSTPVTPAIISSACDAWIGEFSLTPQNVADFRIQKQEEQYVLQARKDGTWQTFDTVKADPSAVTAGVDGKPTTDACVLKGKGGRLIRVPAGTIYEGKKAETGFLEASDDNNKPALFDVYPLHVPAACDRWLGEFGTKAHRPSAMRFEKLDGDYVVRAKDNSGKWAAETEPASYFPSNPDIGNGDKPIQSACTLMVDGGLFLMMPAGTSYQATSRFGSNWGEYTAQTGFLFMTIEGFQVDGHDLYPISAEDEAPKAPIAPPAIRMGLWEVTGTSTLTEMDKSSKPDQKSFDRRRCITPQTWRPIETSDKCDLDREQLENNLYSADISCTEPDEATHVELKFDSAETAHFTMTINLLNDGKPYTTERMSGSEKFIGENCEAVKPPATQNQ
ncbi:DUF3617 domain-containing protein [Silvibacterium dinghuense]|uniref:DUF3617 family protein n=1 Tax=Silvibacterium dinghuense TaxID=1560006 RepID=A0A4Q1SBM8_9BACT|nr:DUF3617 family protein [Silvibacterium dinghuense]RXS94541.1 DUF3617 family protein [Silvibacterium dinghuense]GGH15469.1 hypothetical protein GCM10011586_36570 [Silvibacterium dinghuense]